MWFGRVLWPTVPIGLVLALGLIVFLARDARDDVFHVNRGLLALVPRRPDQLVVGDWLKANEPDAAYVQMPDGSPGISLRLAEDGILRLDPVYWHPRLDYGVAGNPPPAEKIIHARAKYLVLTNDATPQQPDARLVASLPSRYIYELKDSPLFASVVRSTDPPVGTAIPWGDRARKARAQIVSPNRIEVDATSSAKDEDRVLVLQSYVPGWRVEIDGERAGPVNNMSGFLSVEARSGHHEYLFVFDPRAQRYGLAILLGTLLGALLFLSPLHGLVGRLGRRAAVPARHA